MGKYPIFLELGGRRAVVIGAGSVAVRKVQSLLDAGARVVVVADHIDEKVAVMFESGNCKVIKAKYDKSYLTGAAIAIASTNNNALNTQIYKDCQALEIICNVVDVPELCDFYVPAVVKRGHLQIAISTEGDSPAYSGHIRKKLEKIFTDKHGQFLAQIETLRKPIIEQIQNPADRKAIFGKLVDDNSFEYFDKNGPEEWRLYAEEIVKSQSLHATE
ncbi:MAG: precorrin-2 dehydrogenase/sirohydrochlorin ferrochelatase family protein [Planctomycetota bacterium]|jgi:precorrin-2 dehydrogenase/sirohydrochlorin ferrochelatase